MYEWMKVLASMHSYYIENDIRIDDSPNKKQEIVDFQQYIDDNVVISDNTEASTVEKRIIEDRFGEDYTTSDGDHVLINKLETTLEKKYCSGCNGKNCKW